MAPLNASESLLACRNTEQKELVFIFAPNGLKTALRCPTTIAFACQKNNNCGCYF
jgi:hypothetical protein